MYSGKFAEAVKRYGEAATLTPDDPLLLCQLAVAQMQSGDFAQAEPILNQADNLCRQKPGATPVAAVCCHLGAIAWLNRSKDSNDFAAALNAALQSEELWRDELEKRGLGEDHPWLAASLNNLAAIDLLRGDYLGAKALFEGASDAWSQSLGPKDPHVGVAQENLAMLRGVLGQQDQAEQALAVATAIFNESLPKDDPAWIPNRTAASVLARQRARFGQSQSDADERPDAPGKDPRRAASVHAAGPGRFGRGRLRSCPLCPGLRLRLPAMAWSSGFGAMGIPSWR